MDGKGISPGDRVEIINSVGDWHTGTVVDISDVIDQYRNGVFDGYRAVRPDGSSRVFMINNHPSVLRPVESPTVPIVPGMREWRGLGLDGKDVDQGQA